MKDIKVRDYLLVRAVTGSPWMAEVLIGWLVNNDCDDTDLACIAAHSEFAKAIRKYGTVRKSRVALAASGAILTDALVCPTSLNVLMARAISMGPEKVDEWIRMIHRESSFVLKDGRSLGYVMPLGGGCDNLAIDVTIQRVRRMRSSVNGNPRFTLETDLGNFNTKPDAMCAYAVSDHWRDHRAIITLERNSVVGIEDRP